MNDQFKFEKGLSLGQRIFYIALMFMPFIYLIFFVFEYEIGLPLADEWYELVPSVEKYYEGTLSIGDIWRGGRAGHRTFFPRIILIVLARLTGWNFSYTLAVMTLISIGTFLLISCQIKRTARAIGNQEINWIIPIAALIVFSLNQYGNWNWGFGLAYLLSLFASLAGLVLLSNPVFQWWRIRCALLLGFIAITSSSSAVGYWFCALFILFFVSPDNIRRRKQSIILWVIAASVIIYLHTSTLPGVPSLQGIFEQPFKYIKYAIKYLGAAVVPFYMGVRGAMFSVGLLGLILLAYISWVSIRFKRIKFQTLVPYIAMCFYSICSAVLTAFGRIPRAAHRAEPTTSIYTTNSSLFWISTVVFLYLLISANNSELKLHIKNRLKKYAWSFILILLVFLMGCGSIRGSLRLMKIYYHILPAKKELFILKDDDLLRRLSWDVNLIKDKTAFLKKYRLTVFREEGE